MNNLLNQTPLFSVETPEAYKNVKKEFSPSHLDENGQTALFAYVKGNYLDLVDFVLSHHDFDVNFEDESGKTPIFYVKSVAMLKLLAKHGAMVCYFDINEQTPLFKTWRYTQENLDIIKEFINLGLDINETDIQGDIALSKQNRPGIIEYMVKLGANLKHLNKFGSIVMKEWQANNDRATGNKLAMLGNELLVKMDPLNAVYQVELISHWED